MVRGVRKLLALAVFFSLALLVMTLSLLQQATRAFVRVLLTVARVYNVALNVSRDSPEQALVKGYKKLVLKAHPDKGGAAKHFQTLQDAKDKWDALRTSKADRPPGRKWSQTQAAAAVGTVGDKQSAQEGYRVNACSVLLTYQGFTGLNDWARFLAFVRGSLETWGAKHWCATLERSDAGKLHTHLALQFHRKVDRTVRSFAFEDHLPNASANDLLDEGVCRKKFQASVDRSFFYVWADKEGTQRDENGEPCVAGDRQPVWTAARSRYQVLAKWCDNLWRSRKLSHEVYENYLYSKWKELSTPC